MALEIRVLHRHGKGIREIARETGSSRNTVRRYLRNESAARYKPRLPRATKLDPFKGYIAERLWSRSTPLPSGLSRLCPALRLPAAAVCAIPGAVQGQSGAVYPLSAGELLGSAFQPAGPGRLHRRSGDGDLSITALAAAGSNLRRAP
jgi:predicted transcriptional regulator